jgi:hypothetical protein
MQCIVKYATGMYSQLPKTSSEIQIFNFGYISPKHSICVSKDVRICTYFSKPKGFLHQQKSLGHSDVQLST